MRDAKNPVLMLAPARRRLRDTPRHNDVMETPNSFAGIRFLLSLDPMDNLTPWKEGDKPVLYWHALTHGDYWISTPLGEILRYTEERQKLWRLSGPHPAHEVGQLFLDLMDLLPETLEPVPPDIAA
ncbi:MAG TPA: DUF5984 family protein, partial [Candidatus Acidoferrales bacterium]|nr:DUF5984 family protein [Candidatus Acidoferrales bacterium]